MDIKDMIPFPHCRENKNANWLIMNGNRIQIKRKQFEKIIDTLDAI